MLLARSSRKDSSLLSYIESSTPEPSCQLHTHEPTFTRFFTSEGKRRVRDTSRESYKQLIEEGVLAEQAETYLSLLLQNPQGLTDSEASKSLSLPCSTISARRNDCNKGRLLVVNVNGERRKNKSGKSALVWNLNENRGGF